MKPIPEPTGYATVTHFMPLMNHGARCIVDGSIKAIYVSPDPENPNRHVLRKHHGGLFSAEANQIIKE